MGLTTLLAGVNAVLLLSILYVYVRNLFRSRTVFTIGLSLFAGLFLLQNLVSLYFFLTMTPYFVDAVELHVFILTLLQTLAFAIFNWITWK